MREKMTMTTRHTPHTPLSKRVLSEPSTLLGRLLVWGVSLYAALVAFYLVVFRLRVRRLNYAVCIFDKHVLNPVMMFLDRRHWYAAVLRHKGRRSGREYATPVTAEPTADGYVIPLSYGEDVDWLKNVRASGRGTIEARDGTHVVGEPKVIDAEEAMAAVSARARLMYRAFGVECYLKMKRLAEEESARAGIVHQGLPGRSEGACRLARPAE